MLKKAMILCNKWRTCISWLNKSRMSKITILVLCTLMLGSLMTVRSQESRKKRPLIIFDTDMGPDYDDVGAIAILHALERKGECRILATLASDAHPLIAPTIEVFNQYFGRPDIPVGIASAAAPAFTAGNNWNDSLVTRFLRKKRVGAYPSALAVYREVLSGQPDNSVTIVTVGFVSNIRDLLNSKPDHFSGLSGLELVRKKVKNWVAMAGSFPQGREFNVDRDAAASYEVFNKWPKPILFSGYEIGRDLLTGGQAAKGDIARDPVAWAYRYNLKTYEQKPQSNRSSWDQTAVLCAVRPPERYFYVNGPGKIIVDRQGANTWNPDVNARHYFLSHKYPYDITAKAIEELMLSPK
jgi:inosine-uridine nucleoside N-ribohydrolase